MVELIGSEKQVMWATKIRKELFEVLDDGKRRFLILEYPWMSKAIKKMETKLNTESSSTWFIEHRTIELRDFKEEC